MLNLPVVPVYYGALNVPNVTTTPSFIKASDFEAPRLLAKYLDYLDQNDEAYMKYHEWRFDSSGSHFESEYLEKMARKVAGPDELMFYRDRHVKRFPRAAQCCRLCDEGYVQEQAEWRRENLDKTLVAQRMPKDRIGETFFGR